jgi:hypothetical protein
MAIEQGMGLDGDAVQNSNGRSGVNCAGDRAEQCRIKGNCVEFSGADGRGKPELRGLASTKNILNFEFGNVVLIDVRQSRRWIDMEAELHSRILLPISMPTDSGRHA